MSHIYEIEIIYLLNDKFYFKRFMIKSNKLDNAISKAEAKVILYESKIYKSITKTKSIDIAKQYIRNEIEFVSINLYKNNFSNFIDEFNPNFI